MTGDEVYVITPGGHRYYKKAHLERRLLVTGCFSSGNARTSEYEWVFESEEERDKKLKEFLYGYDHQKSDSVFVINCEKWIQLVVPD